MKKKKKKDLPEGDWYCSKECQAGAKAMGKDTQTATPAAEEKSKIVSTVKIKVDKK